MTVHESSLSPSIHAVLAAELGMEEKAVEMYQRTARLDLDNYNNDTEAVSYTHLDVYKRQAHFFFKTFIKKGFVLIADSFNNRLNR